MSKELTSRNVSINDIAERVKELVIGSEYEYILSLKDAEEIACMVMHNIITQYNIKNRDQKIDEIIKLMIPIYYDEEEPSEDELKDYEKETKEIPSEDNDESKDAIDNIFIKIPRDTDEDKDVDDSELKEFIESISIMTLLDSLFNDSCHAINIPKVRVPKINIRRRYFYLYNRIL